MSGVAVVVPSVGAATLPACLTAVAALDPAPQRVVVVLSGATPPALPTGFDLLQQPRRLGFAAAVNAGLAVTGGCDAVALLNDDAVPHPGWLAPLTRALAADPRLAAVQGTVSDASGTRVDGRGIVLGRFGLPLQVDHGAALGPESGGSRRVLAVSGTAAVLRADALATAALADGATLDPTLDSYHEDLDLGLRLVRLGWRAAWVPAAPCRHLGSASGLRFRWRHPWWLLANRWRVLAANLTRAALLADLPRLLRGELRAAATLARDNPRAPLVAAATLPQLPRLVAWGWRRATAGERLPRLPGSTP